MHRIADRVDRLEDRGYGLGASTVENNRSGGVTASAMPLYNCLLTTMVPATSAESNGLGDYFRTLCT
eukprot:2305302-Rhodomonas_salina.1